VPKLLETSLRVEVTILWNQQIQTDRTFPNNKPDIIISDNEKGTFMLIDVANSGGRNINNNNNNNNELQLGCHPVAVVILHA